LYRSTITAAETDIFRDSPFIIFIDFTWYLRSGTLSTDTGAASIITPYALINRRSAQILIYMLTFSLESRKKWILPSSNTVSI